MARTFEGWRVYGLIAKSIIKQMKKLIVLLICICWRPQLTAQELEATLYFRDGTSIKGWGELHRGNKIKFRTSMEEEPEVWTGLMVDAVVFEWYAGSQTYTYIDPSNTLRYELVEVLSEGDVNLFVKKKYYPKGRINPLSIVSNNTPTRTGRKEYDILFYYIQKEGSTTFKKVQKNRFRKFAREYFKSCPDLHGRLLDREFRENSFRDIVDFYNDACIE
ncbi:MAG: hypothetical protein ACJARZ_001226 [Dokdonia sp.]